MLVYEIGFVFPKVCLEMKNKNDMEKLKELNVTILLLF